MTEPESLRGLAAGFDRGVEELGFEPGGVGEEMPLGWRGRAD